MKARGITLEIALTHLTGRARQTAIAVCGVALGVGFFIAMAAMMQGFQGYFVKTVIDVSPHIVMYDEYRDPPRQAVDLLYGREDAAVSLSGVKPKEEIRGIKNAQGIMDVLEKTPDLKLSPTLSGQIFFRYGSVDISATLIGIDPVRERHVTRLSGQIVDGSMEALAGNQNGVIIGDGLAAKLNAGTGDMLTAISPAGIVQTMKVVGIFHTGIVMMDDAFAYCLLKRSQIVQNRPNVVNRIRFALPDPDAAKEAAQAMESRFEYKTESWQEANEGFLSVFVVQNMVMYSTTGAILLVACFGIYNIISTLINEKARDIAILKAIGFGEGDIQKIFLVQGVLIGAAGAVLGWALGFGMSKGLESIRLDLAAVVSTTHLFIVYSPWHYAIGSVACIVAASAAAWIPARRAARMRPVDIIRGAAG